MSRILTADVLWPFIGLLLAIDMKSTKALSSLSSIYDFSQDNSCRSMPNLLAGKLDNK